MADVMEIPRSARKQMEIDAKSLQDYNSRFKLVKTLFKLYYREIDNG